MNEKNYISVDVDKKSGEVIVWERDVDGGPRETRYFKPPYYFYVRDDDGPEMAIDGQRVKKIVCETYDEYNSETKKYRFKYESDFKPEARVLMDKYYGLTVPVIKFAFLDIEVDYKAERGWSEPANPYAPINAITIYQSWTGKYLTYAIPPAGWSGTNESLQAEIKALWAEHKLGFEPDVTICKTERDLLLYMLGDLDEADIVSGWNSEFFDIPYIIQRLHSVLDKRTDSDNPDLRDNKIKYGPGVRAMCFTGASQPHRMDKPRFGTKSITYTLYGRTHLDYLALFKKFTFEGRTSYSLANISAEELDTPKLDYPGTLEELYKNDFAHFITYNARDVEVLVQLDRKFKFMQLVNQMSHENTVPFMAILGTVRYVETGITNRAHYVHKKIVVDKNIGGEKNEKVEGAVVMTPFAGLHEWLGSVDITSLYPSVIRALNMSIETFIGQFEEGREAWFGIRVKDDRVYTLIQANGDEIRGTGAEWHASLRELNWCVSAFGTVFDQNQVGMVADTLTFWFEERVRLNGEKKKYGKLAEAETDPVKKLEYEKLVEHYDLLQLTKKIQLNSTYGALLNEAFRFGRREIGASVTGTGREISTHMAQTIGEVITGRKVELVKRYTPGTHYADGQLIPDHKLFKFRRLANGKKDLEPFANALMAGDIAYLKSLPTSPQYEFKKNPDTGDKELAPLGAIYFNAYANSDEHCKVIIYGDTDSCYFLTNTTNYEDAVAAADEIARITNETFPEFMAEAFNCTDGREKLIKAAREVVAERGLFLKAKKKYTLRVVNLDGKDLRKKPKLKSMGSEIKKADTPKIVQEFLKELMDLVLTGSQYPELEAFINKYRGKLINKNSDVLALAPAKQVNNLDEYYADYKRTEKVKRGKMSKPAPGHVRAAINYNELSEQHAPGSKMLQAGDKVAILYLKPNARKLTSIGFPTDMLHLPEWFTENYQVDMKLTEEKMIDLKIEGIFDAMGMETPTLQRAHLNTMFTF